MILVGCDLHSRKQQVAALDTDTGGCEQADTVNLPRVLRFGGERSGEDAESEDDCESESLERHGESVGTREVSVNRALCIARWEADAARSPTWS